MEGARPVRAPRGTEISAKSWQTEAPLRMLMNNLDPEVAERPDDLVVYGGTGRAARSWEAFDAILASLRDLEAEAVERGTPVDASRSSREVTACPSCWDSARSMISSRRRCAGWRPRPSISARGRRSRWWKRDRRTCGISATPST